MRIEKYPKPENWKEILGRGQLPESDSVEKTVSGILADIRRYGDEKVLYYVRELDGYDTEASGIEVSREEIEYACKEIDEELKSAIRQAAENIRRFHEAQMPSDVEVETVPGVVCRQVNVPIGSVGLYIPGGTAPLFSTVLMLAVPAKIAGCPQIVLCTPARKDGTVAPEILYSAMVCGVTRIFKVGGAVAVGAMAYGTATIPRADKIFGPGNAYVMKAKQMVSMVCSIDMPAGPSEVMIIADESAEPAFVCSDFLSQLEHGKDSQAILLTTSESLALQVGKELESQIETLSRKDFVDKSMRKSLAVVLGSEKEMVDMANLYAPEHLIISTEDCHRTLEGIRNAGSVFLGNYSPESAGDYASGTNHTLPTSGWAVSCSGVNLSSFMKKMTVQEISMEGLQRLGPVIERMAMAEGLDAHANAVKVRLSSGKCRTTDK